MLIVQLFLCFLQPLVPLFVIFCQLESEKFMVFVSQLSFIVFEFVIFLLRFLQQEFIFDLKIFSSSQPESGVGELILESAKVGFKPTNFSFIEIDIGNRNLNHFNE